MSSREKFTVAVIEVDKGNYEKSIEILTEILREKSENTNDFLVVVYKQRADAHYNLRHFQEAAADIDQAVGHGLILSKNEKFFYMYNHCLLECDLNKVIKNFEAQSHINAKWGCRKTAASLKNIRLDNIFTRINRGERERSQSADRINRR